MPDLDSAEFAETARRIRLVGIDFDGVMTDNTVLVFDDGREAVRCSRLEGYGLARLARAGAEAIIISAEANPVVGARAKKLKIACFQGVEDKAALLAEFLRNRDLTWRQTAFIGNDVNDLEVLKRVGLPVVVSDAQEELSGVRAFRTRRPGGAGAVRELCDAIAAVLEDAAGRKSA